MDFHAVPPPEYQAGCDSMRENLCQRDSERVNRTTPGASSSGQLDTPGASSSILVENNTSQAAERGRARHFTTRYLNSMCARFGQGPPNPQYFQLVVPIWNHFTSHCLWASSWLTKDHEDCKRMTMSQSFPRTQDFIQSV